MPTEKKAPAKAKAPPPTKKSEEIKDKIKVKEKYIYAKGGRKTAVAQVRLVKGGKGEIVINNVDYKEYLPTYEMQATASSPLVLSGHDKDLSISIKVSGSGKAAQSEAIRHGLARALEVLDPGLRPVLKAHGFMKRDPRVKERKKPGLKRARRAPQWSKR